MLKAVSILLIWVLILLLGQSFAKIEGTNRYHDIKFNISLGIFDQFGASVKIKAVLTNESSDTVYFLSSTCEGEIYSLKYEASKFEVIPRISCNASYPYIAKIPPHGKFEFSAGFSNKKNSSEIKLGFDFYEVTRYFDLQKFQLSQIYDRGSGGLNVIWANTLKLK